MAVSRLHEATEHLPCTALQQPRDRIYSFRCNYADCASAADVEVGATDCLSIIFRLFHTGGTHVCSDMHPQSLGWLLAGEQADLPEFKNTDEQPAKKTKTVDELVLAMPWLEHLDRTEGHTGDIDALQSVHRGRAKQQELPEDDDIWASLIELEKAQQAAAAENVREGRADFISKVRGGESEILASGVALHAQQGQSLKWGGAWARRRGLQVTFKATFGTHGPAESKVMVRSWCHRMQHFYDLECAAPEGPDLVYSPELVNEYVEPTELTALAIDAANPAWAERIAFIRKIPFN